MKEENREKGDIFFEKFGLVGKQRNWVGSWQKIEKIIEVIEVLKVRKNGIQSKLMG